jgi:N-acetylneuraminic acid mutarotase
VETNTIERYDIKNNLFDIFQISMPEALYGVCSFLVSNSKILIFGGFNTIKGTNYKVFTIDLSNGAINYLKNIENDLWTTLAPFYYNNSIYVISTGEEVDEDMPYIFKYPIQLPLN